MVNFTSLLASLLSRLLKRPVALDSDIPSSLLISQALTLTTGLFRGLVLSRTSLILERGARITNSGRFQRGGGLIRIGAYSRVECVSREGICVGRNFKLGAFSRMVASGTLSDLGQGITVGDNVGISEYAYIGGAGGVRIGSDTIVGQYFSTHSENHVFSDPDNLIREQGVTRTGIEVGPDCWIGAKVTLLDGVTLGRGCVVAAGSVVNQSFPDYAIIAGVPARLLRMRDMSAASAEPTLPEDSND